MHCSILIKPNSAKVHTERRERLRRNLSPVSDRDKLMMIIWSRMQQAVRIQIIVEWFHAERNIRENNWVIYAESDKPYLNFLQKFIAFFRKIHFIFSQLSLLKNNITVYCYIVWAHTGSEAQHPSPYIDSERGWTIPLGGRRQINNCEITLARVSLVVPTGFVCALCLSDLSKSTGFLI